MSKTNRSLRSRVLLGVALVQILTLAVLSGLYLSHARQVIRSEQAAAQMTARDLILSTSAALISEGGGDVMGRLQARLAPLRHLRLQVYAPGQPTPPPITAAPPARPAPGWLARLLAPPPKARQIPLSDRGRVLGVVMVSDAPEIAMARVWRELRGLLGVALLALVGLMGLIHVVIGRALAPLDGLRGALREIEDGQLDAAIPAPATPELAPIAAQVGRLAASLSEAETLRRDLSRRLTALQEDERKHIARELHDEMGPCLFGLSAQADLLAQQIRPDQAAPVAAIQQIIAQLRQINRRVLAALRPTAVGQLPLEDVLRDLVAAQAAQQPGVAVDVQIDPLGNTPEALDLTLYRFIQEGMTNVFRHAHARRIEIRVTRAGGRLEARLRDDGIGPAGLEAGTGLRGMAERLDAQGGDLRITPAPGGGTALIATLPVEAP